MRFSRRCYGPGSHSNLNLNLKLELRRLEPRADPVPANRRTVRPRPGPGRRWASRSFSGRSKPGLAFKFKFPAIVTAIVTVTRDEARTPSQGGGHCAAAEGRLPDSESARAQSRC